MSVLYLSYDGLLEQLGQSQVFQYLRGLSREHSIILLTYEKPSLWRDEARRREARQRVREAGFRWVALTYHQRPALLAKVYDLAVGFFVACYLSVRYRVRLVHSRSYVSTVIALGLKVFGGIPYIFDMRGFWFDARSEMGHWKKSSLSFRLAKWLERQFIARSSTVVALSRGAVEAMKSWPQLAGLPVRYEVVTVCADLDLFAPRPRASAPAGEFVLGYVGNAGPGYLFGRVLECFLVLRRLRPLARLRIVNRRDHDFIRAILAEFKIPGEAVELVSAEHNEVPERMSGMDAGIFFFRADPSRVASVPTRMGEFLASGIPCLSNAGFGNVEEVLTGEDVGVVLDGYDRVQVEEGVKALLALADSSDIREKCAHAARKYFSLADGTASYARLYRELLVTAC